MQKYKRLFDESVDLSLERVPGRPQVRHVFLPGVHGLAEFLNVAPTTGDRGSKADLHPPPEFGLKAVERILGGRDVP